MTSWAHQLNKTKQKSLTVCVSVLILLVILCDRLQKASITLETPVAATMLTATSLQASPALAPICDSVHPVTQESRCFPLYRWAEASKVSNLTSGLKASSKEAWESSHWWNQWAVYSLQKIDGHGSQSRADTFTERPTSGQCLLPLHSPNQQHQHHWGTCDKWKFLLLPQVSWVRSSGAGPVSCELSSPAGDSDLLVFEDHWETITRKIRKTAKSLQGLPGFEEVLPNIIQEAQENLHFRSTVKQF